MDGHKGLQGPATTDLGRDMDTCTLKNSCCSTVRSYAVAVVFKNNLRRKATNREKMFGVHTPHTGLAT